MRTIATPPSLIGWRWYAVQLASVALVIALTTYVAIKLTIIPGPWNALWLIVPPVVAGIVLNKGSGRWAMAVALLVVSWFAASTVGYLMGGM